MRKVVIAAVILLLYNLTVWGVPRYAIMYGQSCVLCHVDPSGGGQRSLYGAQFFAYSDLAMKGLPMEELGKVQPMLNDQIQIGVDARTMFYAIDAPDSTAAMQMQGDLYLNFQLSPQWNFYLAKGLYSGFEIFGMGHFLPYNGYLKVGKFMPPYGLRLADHKALVRTKLGFAENWSETGLEIGCHPEKFNVALSVTKNQAPYGAPDTKMPALTGRTDLRLSINNAYLWFGVSGRWDESSGSEVITAGGYGGLAYKRLFFTGEIDYRDNAMKGLVSFAELAFLATKGLTLRLEHNFYDPNIDIESGAENMYVGGLEFTPTGFLQVIPNLRLHDIQSGVDYAGDDYYEGEVQFHIFF